MSRADVCLILEGSYPYVAGGVSAWTHALIAAAPHLRFHVVSIVADRADRKRRYELAKNVVSCTDLPLDSGFPGRVAQEREAPRIMELGQRLQALIASAQTDDFAALENLIGRQKLGQRALFESRAGWRAMEEACAALLPHAPLLDFYWTWRVMLRSLIAAMGVPLPDARVYHAISTGYAGLLGARAKLVTGRPLLLTEHGIYTNERRVELCLADWLFHSGRDGFSIDSGIRELRDLWEALFASLANLTYAHADEIVTLYRGNQAMQCADGAPKHKLRIIPNGVDYDRLSALARAPGPRRPTIALIGRVVPIKDVRMFIQACATLQRSDTDFEALVIGPDDEDPQYAADCRRLAAQEGLEGRLCFTGRVDVSAYLPRIDICVLTSVSEAQPLVLLEAGAAGIPSVATDVGSCREIIEGFEDDPVKGLGGMVVPVGDAEAAARAMETILADRDLAARMGEVMRQRVAQRYNKQRIDRIYNDLYASHLRRAPLLRAS